MGKAITFMLFVWAMVSLAGGVVQGSTVTMATTTLTANLTAAGTTITVRSTNGFPDSGLLVILDERIAYSNKTATTFTGSLAQPMIRGAQDTDAVAHSSGERVRTLESSMLNNSMAYKLAVMTDSSGLIAFVTVPFAFISLLVSFLVLPLGFLGTDLAILTYIWALVGIGVLVSIGISLAGGRRV